MLKLCLGEPRGLLTALVLALALVETESQFCCTNQQQALEMALCSFQK